MYWAGLQNSEEAKEAIKRGVKTHAEASQGGTTASRWNQFGAGHDMTLFFKYRRKPRRG